MTWLSRAGLIVFCVPPGGKHVVVGISSAPGSDGQDSSRAAVYRGRGRAAGGALATLAAAG